MDDKRIVVRFPTTAAPNFHTDSAVYPPSHSVSSRAVSPGIKRPEREAECSPPSSVKVNEWSHTSTPLYAFMAWKEVSPLPVIDSITQQTHGRQSRQA
jgi:hypothetical protein